MYHEYPQFSWLIRCEFHFADGFEMNSSPVFFLRAAYVHVLLHSSSSDFCFLLSGPTPIHAPRPRPITYSIGIGTSDFGDGSVDVCTQGGPPQLNLSSFLNELSLTGVSSPVRQAPVSVLSPVLRRSFTVASPPPARITLDAAVNAVVDCRDMDINVWALQIKLSKLSLKLEMLLPAMILQRILHRLLLLHRLLMFLGQLTLTLPRPKFPQLAPPRPYWKSLTISHFVVLRLACLLQGVLRPMWLLLTSRRLQWDPACWTPMTSPLHLVCQVN